MSTYPDYIDDTGHGQACMPFPGLMKDTHAYLFAFKGTVPALQALVDKFLNLPNNDEVQYSVLGDNVFVTFMHVAQLSSMVEVIGYSDDHEVGFWVPLLAKPRHGLERVVFWMPYVIIDVYEGMVTGREGWGWRKCYGDVTVPESPDNADSFAAATHVFKTFSATTEGKVETIVTLKRDTPAKAETTWQKLGEAAHAVKQLWSGGGPVKPHLWELAINLAEHLSHENAPIANLKQFRDVNDSSKACYQAITESTIGVKAFHGGGLLTGIYTLDITDTASHPIAQDLGITVPAKADWAIWTHMDMTADIGTEVWKATST
jgi:hypothetical protein